MQIRIEDKAASTGLPTVWIVPVDRAREPRLRGCKAGAVPGRLTVVPRAASPRAKAPAETLLAVAWLGNAGEVTCEELRRAGGGISRWMIEQGLDAAEVVLPDGVVPDDGAVFRAVIEGILLRDYRFGRYRSGDDRTVRTVTIRCPRPVPNRPKTLRAVRHLCAAVDTARDLAHEPPNRINPLTLVTVVRRLARKHGLTCRVIDERRMQALKMNGTLAVGRASPTPPRLIVLEHLPAARRRKRPIVLIGKAITFDTGGYSLKQRDGMLGMKYDKCGGMAVIGAMQAIATLKLNHPVVGLIAAAENMVDATAYRPDDIIEMMNGKTVEIISADAEGRMVLADALCYAQQTYRPRLMVDLATLTGGAMVALGTEAAPLMSNDDALAEDLRAAGERSGERVWPLPLWDAYLDQIRGDDSDLKNSGGRGAQTIVGGMFLKEFVDSGVPWAHLDISAVAKSAADLPCSPKGATGYGVRLLVDFLEHL